MQKYYVAHHGLQQGPWLIDDIAKKLTQKSLLWNDYIYDEKVQDWVLLLEFPLLTQLFNQSFKNPIKVTADQSSKNIVDPILDRSWYILKQNNNYGPFSQTEMIQMLQTKTLFEFDFIWKLGLASWKRLAEVEDFHADHIREVYQSLSADLDSDIFFRRRHARSEYQCQLLIHDHKKLYTAQSLEISAGGAGLQVNNVGFNIDQQLYLHFRPSEHVPAFNAICNVVSKSGSKYGIRFVHVAAFVKESISKYTNKAA